MTNEQNLEPVLILRAKGGWLAVSQPGDPITIGVMAASEIEAREKFITTLQRWREILTYVPTEINAPTYS